MEGDEEVEEGEEEELETERVESKAGDEVKSREGGRELAAWTADRTVEVKEGDVDETEDEVEEGRGAGEGGEGGIKPSR